MIPYRTPEDIEQQAADWVVRKARPDWTGREEAEFDRWINAATEHRVAYLRLASVWERADRLASLRLPTPGAAAHQTFSRRNAIAASLIAASVVLAAAVAWWEQRPTGQLYATETGGHRIVTLTDGSRVELNTETQVRVTVDGKHRSAWLEHGEAYFEVAKAEDLPFVVYAGDQHVKVLGTKFAVRKDNDQVQVGVVEGRVEVHGVNDQPSVPPKVIKPGDLLIAKGRSTLVAFNSLERITASLSWRHGMLVFSDTTLADALAEFNRYNDRKMVVSDDVAPVRIGGSFDATNESGFVELLQQGFGLKVEQQGDKLVISN